MRVETRTGGSGSDFISVIQRVECGLEVRCAAAACGGVANSSAPGGLIGPTDLGRSVKPVINLPIIRDTE